jgi:hypothetical protein
MMPVLALAKDAALGAGGVIGGKYLEGAIANNLQKDKADKTSVMTRKGLMAVGLLAGAYAAQSMKGKNKQVAGFVVPALSAPAAILLADIIELIPKDEAAVKKAEIEFRGNYGKSKSATAVEGLGQDQVVYDPESGIYYDSATGQAIAMDDAVRGIADDAEIIELDGIGDNVDDVASAALSDDPLFAQYL